MSEPYVGEVRMFAGNFAPVGWAFCDGQLLPISENEVLFNLIGTTYGGDGQSTFALPDLRGRIPIHAGTATTGVTYALAEQGGSESVTVTVPQMPAHGHALGSTASATQGTPSGNVLGKTTTPIYGTNATTRPLGGTLPAGGSQPHDNMMPFLAVNFIIALEGVFPQQN
jgi:microcystin-dependent protein